VKAKQLYGEIVTAFPRHGEALFRLGQIVEREGDTSIALKYFQAALAVWPTHAQYKDAVNRLCATSNV
jgi:TolA-binding protein